MAGQNTFSGKLDSKYFYDAFQVLPYNEATDGFGAKPEQTMISETKFTNDDLPNLRGNYLKEMISIYSKKLEPILLEGTVKKVLEKGERNAIIYLFVPEALVDAYERD